MKFVSMAYVDFDDLYALMEDGPCFYFKGAKKGWSEVPGPKEVG